MKPILRMNDPRVTRIMAEKQAQTKFINGRTYRAAASAGRRKLEDVLQDGAWAGQPCFIVGGGPSIKGFDFERLRGRGRAIAINKAFYDVPFADVMFSFDSELIDDLRSGKIDADYRVKCPDGPPRDYRQAYAGFTGIKILLDISSYSFPPDVYPIESAGDRGWSTNIKFGVCHGGNSGYGALNLAMIMGANPIYLLGFDCQKGPNGEKNYHEGYPSAGNPDALSTFKNAFEEGAKQIPAGGPRIINLNPTSALRCFAFGDIDTVLPPITPAGLRVTVITPTGDRPLAFSLMQRWMAQQTRKPDQWIIVDDGRNPMDADSIVDWFNREMPETAPVGIRRDPQPNDPPHTLSINLAAALPYITGDKIIICEDDEYYAPGYIEEMARRLDSAELAGICQSKYYHLPSGGYCAHSNRTHASLAQTAFRASFLPEFSDLLKEASQDFLDIRLWKRVNGTSRGALFVDNAAPLYLGIKGLPGRNGIGIGHNGNRYALYDKGGRPILRQWIPGDFQVYLDIIEGRLK